MSDPIDSAASPANARTLPELIRRAAANYGDDIAITLKGDTLPDDAITFRELDEQSAVLARGLLAQGVGKGSRIGFIHGNGPSFAVTLAAITRIGAIAIPVSTFIKANELVRVLRQSDIAGLVVQRSLLGYDYVERLCEALPELLEAGSPELRLPQVPYLRWIVSTGDALPAAFRDRTWLTESSQHISEALLQEVESEVHPTDQMIEIYTSGAMAFPKGVRHCHGPVLYRTHYLRAMRDPGRGGQLAAIMPMFWVGGLIMYLLPGIERGATVVCTEGTSTDSRMAMGSVPANDAVIRYPEGMTIWALGMTETMGPYSYADEARAPGYPLCPPIDHIADGFEIRVVDEHESPVSPGGIGEIQIRGYPLTPGLHKMERRLHFTADGFYRTGDMAVVEGTRIHFVGRNGDMIKTASANVSPAEVEMELQQLDGIQSAYVVGIPDEERGQLVAAALVPRDGISLDYDNIRATLRQRLSSYKVPRLYISITRDEVPMLPSNKVARREIERMIVERLKLGATA